MDFFTEEDFEYYSKVLSERVTSKSTNWLETRNQLTKKGVFSKTGFWAKQFKDKGYKIEFRNDCQFSGKLRKYTWAKIYLKGYEGSDIFFTVGVGSRFQHDNRPFELLYKIDCQRKKGQISPYQIDVFDSYFKDIKHFRSIEQDELINNSWDSLIIKTQNFINDFEGHYKNVSNLVWPKGIDISPKVARLCWNDFGWEKPSGSEGKSKNKSQAFESTGFGHEEWLFDLDRVIDGYHYGFIQAFNNVPKHEGKTYDVHLYTINNNEETKQSDYYWLGRINAAEVLTKVQRENTFQVYKDKGWFDKMLNELKDAEVIDPKLDLVKAEDWFNVRYKIEDDTFIKFKPLKLIENPVEQIGKGNHYVLMDLLISADSVENTTRKYKFKPGHNPTKTGSTKSVQTKKTINRSLKHKEIQELMYHQLVKENDEDSVGTEVPTGYGTSIDVVVIQPDKSEWFYEVKTYNQPLICIREAFGQILEYSMFSKNNHADKLIVVGVNKPSQSEIDYLNHIREITNLNIYYQVFNLEVNILEADFY